MCVPEFVCVCVCVSVCVCTYRCVCVVSQRLLRYSTVPIHSNCEPAKRLTSIEILMVPSHLCSFLDFLVFLTHSFSIHNIRLLCSHKQLTLEGE